MTFTDMEDSSKDQLNITWKTVYDGSYIYLQGEINARMIRSEFKKGTELRVSFNFDVGSSSSQDGSLLRSAIYGQLTRED